MVELAFLDISNVRTKMFRVSLFSDYFFDEGAYGGGIGMVVANLARELSNEGLDVYVFTAASSRKRHIKFHKNLYVFKYSSIIRIFNTFLSVELLIEPLRYETDIAHIEGGVIATLSGLLYSVIRGKPLVITVHHMDDVWKDPIKNFILKIYNLFILKIVLKKANKIIVPSKYLITQSKYLTNFKYKIIEISNGVDINSISSKCSKEVARKKLGLPLDVKIVLFVGALCRRKGLHILIKTAKKVVNALPNSLFVIIGPETEETEDLKALIKAHELEKHFWLVGYVADSIKNLYYKAADLFVLPSLSEGFGLVLLEAAVNDLPLIVSDLPVFKTLVMENYNGFFSKKGDFEDLANKICYLLKDDTIRAHFGENSKKLASTYSWSKTASNTLKLYLQVLNTV